MGASAGSQLSHDPGTRLSQLSQRSRLLLDERVVGQVRIRARSTRSISSAWPGLSSSCGSRHQRPASSPWRRSTSWMPGMQPANWWAGSNSAALASVSSAPSASSAERAVVARSPAACGRQRRSSSTARVRPDRPLAEQAARKAQRRPRPSPRKWRQQIRHDRVVVAGVERDVVAGRSRPARVTTSSVR